MPRLPILDLLPSVKSWLRRLGPDHRLHRGNRAATPEEAAHSFGRLVEDRQGWLFATLPAAAADVHWDIFLKSSQKRLARRLGIEVAADYASGVTLDAAFERIEELGLERFVIKPDSSRSGRGCRSLLRDGRRFRELGTGRRLRPEQLKRMLRRDLIRGRDDAWIVEELLLPVDGVPRPMEDVKLYCFGGVAELILHKRVQPGRRKYRAQFHTRDWTPVNVGLEDRDDLLAAAPIHGERMVAEGERVAAQLCYPFIRIDLYATSRGIVLGEFTPGPGRAYGFDADWNARLVRRWHEAARAIEDGVASGRITPLGAVP